MNFGNEKISPYENEMHDKDKLIEITIRFPSEMKSTKISENIQVL